MNKDKYWAERQAKRRLVSNEQLALSTSVDIKKLYNTAIRSLTKDVNALYSLYSDKTGLDVSELSQVLRGTEKKNFLLNIQKKMQELGFDVEDVYQPRLISRITRLEALKEKMYWEIISLKAQEERVMTRGYKDSMVEAYDSIMSDYIGSDYTGGMFTTINRGAMQELLRERWSGKNYSELIWGKRNLSRLAKKLPEYIGTGIATGRSYVRTAREVRQAFGVDESSAMRIVRTESAYFTAMSELEAMKNLGIKKYEYYAIMDSRTSDICEELDGQVFEYSKAEAGENYPPMHPNCRSRAVPLVDDEEQYDRQRERFLKLSEEREEEEEEEAESGEFEVYPEEYGSAYDFLLAKYGVKGKATMGEWLKGSKGDFTLVLNETDSRVTLSAIGTKNKGKGLGSDIMGSLKEYSDASMKLFVVDDVINPEFFRKFDWLEEKESLKAFMYSPVPDDTRNWVKNNSPIVAKTNKVQAVKEVSPSRALSEYKDYRYTQINDYLRGKLDNTQDTSEVMGYVNALDSLFKKEGDIHTYRADGGGVLASILENEPDLRLKLKEFKGYDHNKYFNNMGKVKEAFDNLVGKEYLEKAYMSTSTSDRIIKKFSDGGDLSEWGVPAYLNISGKSKYIKMGEYMTDTEQEILLPRNTKLRIDSIRIEPVSREGYSGSRGEQFIAKINATIVK